MPFNDFRVFLKTYSEIEILATFVFFTANFHNWLVEVIKWAVLKIQWLPIELRVVRCRGSSNKEKNYTN